MSELERMVHQTQTILKTLEMEHQHPIDPVEVARKMGISMQPHFKVNHVEKEATQSCHQGALEEDHVVSYQDTPMPIINYDLDERPRRGRFALAHALGHHFLEHGPCVDHVQDYFHIDCTPSSELNSEGLLSHEQACAQANQFALLLLMPVGTFESQMRYTDDSAVLGAHFGVGVEAVEKRLILSERWKQFTSIKASKKSKSAG